MTDGRKPEVGEAGEELGRVVGTARGEQSGADGGEVGYGRPPASGQFTKGRSGNPKGRPKGMGKRRALAASPQSLDGIVLAAAQREVPLTGRNGRVEKVPMLDAVVQTLSVKAAKGSNPAIRTFTQRVAAAEAHAVTQQLAPNPRLTAGLQLKTAAWMFEVMFGVPPPSPLPRFDEVDVDLISGDVTFRRPMGRQDQAFWDACWMMRRECEAELGILTGHLAVPAFFGLGIELEERRSVIDQSIRMIDRLLIAKWRLTPAELAAPPRHVRPGMTWDRLQDELSPVARGFIGRAQATLLGQQLLRQSYELAVGSAAGPDAPTLEALRARLRCLAPASAGSGRG